MADIHIERPTSLPPEEALMKFESEVLSLPNLKMFVESYKVEGRTVTFGGSRGVSGRVEASPGKVAVDVQLSALASMMRPLIESRLNEILARLFPA